MAVYERRYRRYTGETTPTWSRFLILPRYAFADVFASKLLVVFLVITFLWPAICAVWMYLLANAQALEALGIRPGFFAIDAAFFATFLNVQGGLAFLLTVFVGPGLVSKDLANNALPLYLARPFSRVEYVAGKLSVLAILLSAITWVPGLLLFVIQSNLAGWSWMTSELRIAAALFVGSWLWILTLSLLALALSAWVRWRTVAGFLLLAIYFGGGFFALMIDVLFRTRWGDLVHLGRSAEIVWSALLGTGSTADPPAWAAGLVMATVAGLSLWLLDRKVRAYEVVR